MHKLRKMDIVEADDGHLRRNIHLPFGKHVEHADCHQIVGGDDGRDAIFQVQEMAGCVRPCFEPVVSGEERRICGRQANLLYGLKECVLAQLVGQMLRGTTDESDPATLPPEAGNDCESDNERRDHYQVLADRGFSPYTARIAHFAGLSGI